MKFKFGKPYRVLDRGEINSGYDTSFWTINFIFPENEYHLGSDPFLFPILSLSLYFGFGDI